jgi:hypothetical protein
VNLAEAVVRSLQSHPEEWEMLEDTREEVSGHPESCQTVLHRRTGLRVQAWGSAWASCNVRFWSPRAKEWFDDWSARTADVRRALQSFRQSVLWKDQNDLPALLAGTKTKFTEDAEALARSILAGEHEAAYAAIDNVLEYNKRGGS